MKRRVISMISLVAALGSLAGLSACSPAPVTTETIAPHKNHTRMGSHGMAVIGDANLLFVHMALYRRPHDRQILTPAKFRSPDAKVAFDRWRGSHDGLISIVPENFDLDRLAPGAKNPISSFSADIYAGHFERGGKIKFEKILFDLARPLLHLPVTDDAPTRDTYTYLTHGTAAYLVRHIGPRPGKDEILSVTPSARLKSGERLYIGPHNTPEQDKKFVTEDGRPVDLQSQKIVYLETADFAGAD